MMIIQFFSLFPRTSDIEHVSPENITYLRVVLAITSLVILGLIIYADKAEKPWAYTPFLFVAVG